MLRPRAALVVFALLITCSTARVGAQAVRPTNNFLASVNGAFVLCPKSVEGGAVPDAAAAASLGFKPITSPEKDEVRFESLFKDGHLEVWFVPAKPECTAHYYGVGFRAVAGVARDLAAKNGYVRLTGGPDGGAQVDVLTRSTPQGGRSQFIIVENAKSNTAAVSFTVKPAK